MTPEGYEAYGEQIAGWHMAQLSPHVVQLLGQRLGDAGEGVQGSLFSHEGRVLASLKEKIKKQSLTGRLLTQYDFNKRLGFKLFWKPEVS